MSQSATEFRTAFHAPPTDAAPILTDEAAPVAVTPRVERVIWVGLLALPVLTAIPYGTVEIWWQALGECWVFALAALWLWEGWRNRHWRISEARLLCPLLLLTALAVLQTLAPAPVRSADPFETQRFALRLLALAVYLELLLSYLTDARRLRQLVYVILGVGTASAGFGLLRLALQKTNGFFLPALMLDSSFAQFINRNHFAFLMEMSLGLALGILVGGGAKRRQPYVYGVLIVLFGVALGLSKSRGGLLAVLGQTMFLGLTAGAVRARKRRRREAKAEGGRRKDESEKSGLRLLHPSSFTLHPLIPACGLVLTVGAALLWVGGAPLTQRLAQTTEDISLESTRRGNTRRIDIWRATLPLIAAQPLTGQGLGGYWMAVSEFHDASGEWVPRQAHNDYLELLASGGLLGLALFVWFARELVQRARPRLRSPDAFRRAVALGATTGLAGVALHSLVDFGLHITVNAVCCAALVALAVARGRTEGVRL